jgi:long-chain acyl-CoA synthetase
MNLGTILESTVRRVPGKTALIYKGQKYTFKELLKKTDKLANSLLENGVNTSAKVAILLENRPEYLITYYACHRIGAVVVPINNFLKGEEIRYILDDCSVNTIVTSAKYYEAEIKGIVSKLPNLQNVVICETPDTDEQFPDESQDVQLLSFTNLIDNASSEEPKPTAPINDEDLAVIIYTSGTTGHPKGAMLSHRNLVANAKSSCSSLEITKKDKMLLFLPMFHSFTELVCMVIPIFVGMPIILVEKIDRIEIRAAIKRYFPTIMTGVPSVYNALLGAKLNLIQRLLNPIRVYISGAAPLPVEVLHKFEDKFRRPLLEGYGLSEASPVVSVNPLHRERKAGSVGLPVRDVEVKIVDEEGKAVDTGVDGEITISGPNVMMGYFNQPEETAASIKDGWLYTGDIGHLDEEGFLYIVERKKDMLIYRGCNIYPREVEEVLYKHPAIQDVAVVGVPDAARGEMPKAFVVLKEGEEATEKELRRFCMEHLARYKVPKFFSFETELPRTATGKVLKKDLRKRVLEEAKAAIE